MNRHEKNWKITFPDNVFSEEWDLFSFSAYTCLWSRNKEIINTFLMAADYYETGKMFVCA